MKMRYDKEDDVMMIWFSKEPVDYAEQNKDLIVHFSKKNKPVLIEILDATNFLQEATNKLPSSVRQHISA